MDARYLTAKLSKRQCLAFLDLHMPERNAPKKAQLIEVLLARIEQTAEMARLLTMFAYELAVEPAELSEVLHCSRDERRRWLQEGRLPVLEYRQTCIAGREHLFPVFDRQQVLLLSPTEIQRWREEHQVRVKENRQAGIQLAAERRSKNRQARRQNMESWLEMVKVWSQIVPPELVIILQLCYWTVLASRWAKENQVRAARSKKLSALYLARKEAWYTRKNEAMRLLATTPYAYLAFYRPANADRRYLWLCDEHYKEKHELCYENVWDFFAQHGQQIKHCSECSFTEEKDYYALYYLEVKSALLPDLHFSFHIPYTLGKSCFPAPETLPLVQHVEQDGLFRFGRPLLEEEKRLHPENDVLKDFELAFQAAKTCDKFSAARQDSLAVCIDHAIS